MGNIILLKNYQKKSSKKYTLAKTVKIPNENKSITDFIGYTASKRSGIQNRYWQKSLEQTEKEEKKAFEERYGNILTTAPCSNEAKLRYLQI